MTDPQARARVWPLCLAALVLATLTGPIAGLLAPLAHASSTALNIVAAALAAALNIVAAALAAALVGGYVALVGGYVALAALLIVAVLRVVRPRLDGHR